MSASPFFTFKNYLKYRQKAVGSHSIHSPFVFKLFTEIISKSSSFRIPEIEEARKKLKGNHELIDVIDFKSNTSFRKTISTVAKTSLSSANFSAFLLLLVNEMQPKTVLETGTSLGINTMYLSHSSAQKVVTMEASAIISELAKKEFRKLDQDKILLEFGDLTKTFEQVLVRYNPEFIFLDADHRGSALKMQIEKIMKLPMPAACIVIHDIYWSQDMQKTWQELVSDTRFALSIDIFQAGILFPFKSIEKQHFTLRF